MRTVKAMKNDRPVMLIGLAETDLLNMKDANAPIQISLNGEMGNNFDIVMFYGATDELIDVQLQGMGLKVE